MANFTALKTAINNAIKTNGNEEITGAILQAILDAMVETLGDSAINDLENAITTEVTNRQNAVSGVADDLAAEALARANKDNQLDDRINQEEYNRQNADAALSRTVDQGFQTLNSQMTALNAAISALNAAYQNGFLYGGIATPSSSPSNNKCFYIALQGGTYTNFGGVGVVEGINIIKNDSGWKVEHIYDQTTLLNEFYLLRQQVIQAITSFAPIVIEGDVTNAPDEEDLTSNANHLLQFKNNAYSPLEFSGLGRKYLRKNIAPLSDSAPFNGFVEGVTAEETLSGTPTQIFWDRMNTRFVGIKDGVYYLDWTDSGNYVPVSTSLVYMYNGTPYQWTGSDFIVDETEVPNLVNCLTQDMINEPNTIYIIRYDYTLKEDITIPENCVLEFDGGSLGNGSIDLNNCDIVSVPRTIFNGVVLNSNYTKPIVSDWFGIVPGSTVSSTVIANLIRYCNIIRFRAGTFTFTGTINISDSDSILVIIGAEHGRDRFPITIFNFVNCDGINITVGAKRFENIGFVGNNVGTWDNTNKIYTDTKCGIKSTVAFGLNKCSFTGFGYGINIANGVPVSLKIFNSGFNSCLNDGIKITFNGTSGSLNHCIIQGCYFNSNGKDGGMNTLDSTGRYSGHGISIGSGNAVYIVNNVFEYNAGCGIYMAYDSNKGLRTTVIGNDFEHNKYTQLYITRNEGGDNIYIKSNFYTDGNVALPSNSLRNRRCCIRDDNSLFNEYHTLETISREALLNAIPSKRNSLLYLYMVGSWVYEDGVTAQKTSSYVPDRTACLWNIQKNGWYCVNLVYKVDEGQATFRFLKLNVNGNTKDIGLTVTVNATSYTKLRVSSYIYLNAGDYVYIEGGAEFANRTYNYIWIKNFLLEEAPIFGTTSERPSLPSLAKGFIYSDTNLAKGIMWDGSTWVNVDGTPLS